MQVADQLQQPNLGWVDLRFLGENQMAIEAVIDGNLLEAPSQRMVAVGGKQVRITEMRVMSDSWKRGPDDELVQDAEKTKPVGITIWNERLGEHVMKTLRSGMRLQIEGSLYLHTWTVSDEDRASGKKDGAEMRCNAEDVAVKLNRIESINMRAKQDQSAAPAA